MLKPLGSTNGALEGLTRSDLDVCLCGSGSHGKTALGAKERDHCPNEVTQRCIIRTQANEGFDVSRCLLLVHPQRSGPKEAPVPFRATALPQNLPPEDGGSEPQLLCQGSARKCSVALRFQDCNGIEGCCMRYLSLSTPRFSWELTRSTRIAPSSEPVPTGSRKQVGGGRQTMLMLVLR